MINVHIITYSGNLFNPLEPKKCVINIEDIAHALSNMCRFSGHTKQFYSVAQHSVLVSNYVNPVNSFAALLHDASEAYIVDIPTPYKMTSMFSEYRNVEKVLMDEIYHRFHIENFDQDDINSADHRVFAAEVRDLMQYSAYDDWNIKSQPVKEVIVPLLPHEAEQLFINRFIKLREQL